MRKLLFTLILFLAVIPAWSQSVPNLTTYQGKLTDSNGLAAADGTGYEIEIRLWATATGGAAPIWGARYSGVSMKQGALNLILGSGSGVAIPGSATADLASAFNNSSIFLGMTVTKGATGTPIANPSEILPRQQWMTSPFAFRAQSVVTGGVDSSSIANDSIQKIDLSPALRTEIDQLVPAGTVVAFGGSSAPLGWLVCDGSNVSRSQYSTLFAAIGSAHGNGNGTSTFALPDYRGRFLRGVNGPASDGGPLRDPDAASRVAMSPGGAAGNTVGSIQSDSIRAHAHNTDGSDSGNQHPVRAGGDSIIDALSRDATANDANYIPGSKTGLSGGSETRPANAYVTFIIKL